MTRYKSPAQKKRLAKKGTQTRWAPFWTVLRKYGKGRKVHPSRHTHVKRSWRRSKTKV
jgi:ribosomal protein L39E